MNESIHSRKNMNKAKINAAKVSVLEKEVSK